jgi:hypothetical protein
MADDKTLTLTSIRFSEEDRKVLDRLCKLAGLDSASAAIRLAIRESVATREQKRRERRQEMVQEFSLPEWWDAILAADAKDVGDEPGPCIPSTVMHCVFCHRDLKGLLIESAASTGVRMKGGGVAWPSSAMVAWWRPSGPARGDDTVLASGLYCNGVLNGGRCVAAATAAGTLADVHAEPHCGPHAFDLLASVATTYRSWNGYALQRLVFICSELARISESKRPR